MKTKPATKKQKARMKLIKELGCLICGSAPCDCHHLLSGGVRRGHDCTIGLCPAHHTGHRMPQSFICYHGRKKMFHEVYGTDDVLLAMQNELLKKTGFEV